MTNHADPVDTTRQTGITNGQETTIPCIRQEHAEVEGAVVLQWDFNLQRTAGLHTSRVLAELDVRGRHVEGAIVRDGVGPRDADVWVGEEGIEESRVTVGARRAGDGCDCDGGSCAGQREGEDGLHLGGIDGDDDEGEEEEEEDKKGEDPRDGDARFKKIGLSIFRLSKSCCHDYSPAISQPTESIKVSCAVVTALHSFPSRPG